MDQIRINSQIRNKNSKHVKIFAFAVILSGMVAFTAVDAFSQKAVRIVEEMNQVARFNKTAPVNTIKPAGQQFDQVLKSGNAARDKRLALRIAQNSDDLVKAGNAALKNRKTLQQLRQAAKTTKNLRRGVIAGTGVGVVFVGGMWIAESLLGDSLDDIAIDAVTSLAQGKRVDHVIGQVGKRLDPARLANNLKRNLDKTGRDISNAFNFIGRELGKVRL